MFLKRLELHGFKSFAHKTAIEFLPGITIVVGPNGCGKSNVLDAIRWVLGETSAKSLRGSKMGDVVFRGSASLKPAHFAQINLLVNNEHHDLRIDHSEVMVSRRLFSNGDSDYLINKQKGRMRDIHELFMDTGLGADNYAIIEQGQISTMVQAKPRERREIFEEAAGISRYKARREETLRKLVRTEEDLLRLFDIVNEVQRACNSLYRQARKAVRFRKAKRRLERLQKRLLVIRRERLAEKLESVEAQLGKARDEFETANSALAAAEAKRAEATRLMEDYQNKSQDLQQQRFDVQQAVNREQRRIESAKQNIAAINERVVLLEREIASSTNRLQILTSTLSALEVDLERERGELEKATTENEEKARRLESLRRESDDINSQLARLRQEIQTERSKENKVLQDRRSSESLVERLNSELENHGGTMRQLRQEAEEAEQQATEARETVEKHRARLEELKAEAARYRDEISDHSKEKNDLAERLDQLTRQYNQADSRLNALQELEDSYEGFYRGVQVVMKAAQSDRLQGIIGVLTNQLAVPKQYEVAIEVALGASLQDIITVSEKDAQAAIRYLKESKKGRATFLPLDLLDPKVRTDHLRPIWGHNGVVGLAKELVRYDEQIEKAVARRLGNTVIVEELPVAVQLQKEGIRNRYVSLDGELVDPSGVLTGGSHQSRGFLSRTREIRQLRDQVEKLAAERKDLSAQLEQANDRLSHCHARSAEIQAEVHDVQMDEARAEKDLQSAEARLKDRRNALATGEAREVQQRHDLHDHEERITSCDEALVQLQQTITRKEEQMAELENNTPARAQDLETLSEEVSDGRARISGLRERVSALSAKLDEVREESRSANTEQGTRHEEIDRLAHDRAQAEIQVQDAEKLLGELVRESERIDSELSTLKQDNEASLKDAHASMSEVQGLQRDRNVKENALREVESEATNLKAQIDVREEEAQEEFSMSIAELAEALKEEMQPEGETIEAMEGQEEEEAENTAEEDAKLFAEDDAMTETAEMISRVNELRDKIQRMGAVNETAIEEYKEQKERLDFLTGQRDDLIEAKDSLAETIKNLDETTKRLFDEAYTAIRQNFQEMFRRLFNGGKGDLILVEDENSPEPGIDIYAQPPGKNIGGSIALLSGGEKAMTAIALMLSLFQYKPSPVCILDEIDAPLDDTNCSRLADALKEFSRKTQFLIITHNKITMGLANTIYGVTMQEPGISKVVSVRFDQIEESGLLEDTAG